MNTNKIQIEDVTVIAGVITVFYFVNDGELQKLTVTTSQLRLFALNTGLNEFVFDYNCGGEHIQLDGSPVYLRTWSPCCCFTNSISLSLFINLTLKKPPDHSRR